MSGIRDAEDDPRRQFAITRMAWFDELPPHQRRRFWGDDWDAVAERRGQKRGNRE